MGDGLSDARAIDDLVDDVGRAARQLSRKLRAARLGHRGWRPDGDDLLNEVRDCLSSIGLRVEIGDVNRWNDPPLKV